MSAGGRDDAARLMVECIDALGDVRAALVAGDATGEVAKALVERGAITTAWLREACAGAGSVARAWPSPGTYDCGLIRLPKAKPALRFALHAVAVRLEAGMPIAVFGRNDEGIRSVARALDEVASDVETLAVGHHARVLGGRRKTTIAGLKPRLGDWRETAEIEIAGVRRAWVSYPGTFAKGGLDAGTAFLLRHLPEVRREARILDYAAGTGVIAATVLARVSDARIDMIDADALAIEAARANVPLARGVVGDSLEACGNRRYDLILSNPPVHEGVAESRRVLDRLIAEAPRHLTAGGRLVIVVQRRVAVVQALTAAFGNSRVVAGDGRFTVAAAELISAER